MKKWLGLFCIGAAGYSIIEILARGYTHWTMAVTGGVCLMLLWLVNTRCVHLGVIAKSLVGAGLITAIELVIGLVVNVWLGLAVWSYADEAYNILGQICPEYSLYWFLLCLAVLTAFKAPRLAQRLRAK